jgi:hypothetical protein
MPTALALTLIRRASSAWLSPACLRSAAILAPIIATTSFQVTPVYHAQDKNSRETWHSTHFDGLHTIRVVSFSGKKIQLRRKTAAEIRQF